MPYNITKYYAQHGGVDLKSSDLNRPETNASGLKNIQYTKSGAIEKRAGYQAQGISQGGLGDVVYNKINLTTGVETEEHITFSDSIYRRDTTAMTVTYSGGATECRISIYYDTVSDVYKCEIVEGVTTVLNQSLGIGVDEATPYMVSSLVTTIAAIPNFAASATGSPTTTPAAFLNIIREYDVKTASLVVNGYYYTELNKTITSPLSGSNTNKNSTEFEVVSATQLSSVLFISNGYDDLLKYDGQTVYKAGMPSITAGPGVTTPAGALPAGTYDYEYSYVQIDNVNNTVEGNLSPSTRVTPGVGWEGSVTVNNLQAATGYNTNCALVNGNQVGVNTIVVTNTPHTMKVGDTAYFLDGASAAYVTRNVTAVTATTVVVDGAVVNVLNNAVISNNLRIAVYRSKIGGGDSYLVNEIPNNSFAATQVYVDAKTDAQLGAQFLEPLFDRSPPPKGKYLASFDGLLFVGGQFASPKTVYHSSIEGVEYFPSDGSHEDDIEAPGGDKVTGIGASNDVCVAFSSRSTHIYSGDIRGGNYRVQPVTYDVGCAAHATIKDLRGILAFLSDRGPYAIIGGQVPIPLGEEKIEPLFDQIGKTPQQTLRLKRAIGFNDRKGQKYWLYLPAESTTGSNRYPNANTIVAAFDYYRNAWLLWDNINAHSGIVSIGGDIFFHEKRQDVALNIKNYLYRVMVTGDAYDYQDNIGPITWNYKTAWESLGEPSVFKKFLRLKAFQLEPTTNNEFTLMCKMETDYLKDFTRGDTTINFNSATGYGESSYGLGPYGDFIEQTRTIKLANGRFRSMRIVFENAEEQANVLLTGWELEIATVFDTQIKD